jgi:NAD(P) transhydrogenase subunit beta
MEQVIGATYLVAAALFIYGLQRMGTPATARSGNQLAAAGMVIAVAATLLDRQILNYWLIGLGIAVGGALGTVAARAVRMTAMPQMVALFNGMGGGAAALVSTVEFLRPAAGAHRVEVTIPLVVSAAIGAASFSGSLVAFGKLQGLLPARPTVYPLQQVANALLLAVVVVAGASLVAGSASVAVLVVMLAAALLLGAPTVLRIGGADMPVVISLLNSFTGLAVAATGFVLQNNLLIVSGTLVGASGTILTRLMSRAMNRSLGNVLFGAFGRAPQRAAAGAAGGATGDYTVRESSPEDAAILLAYAKRAVIVPGYGMAVAQAQHQVRELADLLGKRGVDVKFGIHPVAGRMPGHMNVLLAEANVPYEQLSEMEAINPEFPRTDVVLVIGANDVTNPAARTKPGSPIYGMPILDVDQAANVIVMKRSLAPGFAGIDNDLYLNSKTSMLFGDAKDSLGKLIGSLKAV